MSGRKRRFAKSVNWETGSAGSNPVRSAGIICAKLRFERLSETFLRGLRDAT